jgi:hypothetical protein
MWLPVGNRSPLVRNSGNARGERQAYCGAKDFIQKAIGDYSPVSLSDRRAVNCAIASACLYLMQFTPENAQSALGLRFGKREELWQQ